MGKGLKGLFDKIAGRIYIAGKKRYEEGLIRSFFGKGTIDPTVRFSPAADLQNLSGNKNAVRIGAHSNIEGLIMVYPYGVEISIGAYCSLSPNSRLIAVDKISIGDRVLIAHNVNIIDNNSHPTDAALRHQDF